MARDFSFRIEEYSQSQGFIPVLEPQGKEVRFIPLLLQEFLGDDEIQRCAYHVELSYKKYPLLPGWIPRYGSENRTQVLCFNRAGMSMKYIESVSATF